MSNYIKTYMYNTQADLKDLSYANILLIDPNEVNYNIETQTGGVILPVDKMNALKSLLKYKRSLDEQDAELNLEGYRFLTKTQSVFNPIAPSEGNFIINVLVGKNLTYVAGNSIIVTNLQTPLQTRFEATVVSYNHSTGMLAFTNIVNLKGIWTTNTPAVINLDGIDGPQGPTRSDWSNWTPRYTRSDWSNWTPRYTRSDWSNWTPRYTRNDWSNWTPRYTRNDWSNR